MALVAPWLRLKRLDTGATYATSVPGEIITFQVNRDGDKPEHLRLEIAQLSALSIAIIAATGGPSLTAALIPLKGEFSEDGGVTVDCRFVLVSAQRSMDPAHPVLTIDQDDMASLYTVTGVDRVTFIEAQPSDVLNGQAGTVPRPPGSIGANRTWLYQKGMYQVKPGLGKWAAQASLAMTPVIDPILAGPLSLDAYADMIANATTSSAKRLSGTWVLGDTAPPGARGHWVSHTGDAARNPIGVAQCISIGRVGKTIQATFNGDTFDGAIPGTWDETVGCHFASQGMSVEPLLALKFAQASFDGGSSNHGLSDGSGTSGSAATNILCAVVINTGRGKTSTNWDDNLPVVGTTSGVYYHVVGSGLFVPMSQPMVINAIAYDADVQLLYVATPFGVFFASANPPPFKLDKKGNPNPGAPWQRLGGTGALSAPVEDLWLDGATVLARCGGTTKKNGAGIDGVYQFPAISGDTTGDKQGYAGWSRIHHSGSPFAAGGSASRLYYSDKNAPNVVYVIQPGTSAAPVKVGGIAAGQNVIAINTVGDHVFILTDAGNSGLYSLPIGNVTALSAGSGMASNDGAPVQIRRIQAHGTDVFGEYVAAFAATNAGLFRTGNLDGGGWSAPDAKSGLGDFDIAFIMAGREQTVLGRQMVRMFAGAESSFLVSCNAGDNWKEILKEKIDTGAAWYARAQRCGGAPWPDNTIGALGDVPGASSGTAVGSIGQVSGPGVLRPPGNLSPSGGTDTGGTGSVLSTNGLPAKERLPQNWIRARRLDEQSQFTFRIVNLSSDAPMAGIQFQELSELTASANIGVITASEQVELAEFHWLYASSITHFQIPIQGSYTKDNAVLRDTCFGDMVRVLFSPPGWEQVLALDLHLYVISHSKTGGTGYVGTTTVVGTSLENAQLDPHAEAAAQADRLTKLSRFGAGS